MNTGDTIKLAKTDKDPYSIMIPYDFKYPKEKICICGTVPNKCVYTEFNDWA